MISAAIHGQRNQRMQLEGTVVDEKLLATVSGSNVSGNHEQHRVP
jgi:hypothetical protein